MATGEVGFVRVEIAAHRARLGRGFPDVCVRHGEPATAHRRAIFVSKPPPWTLLLFLVGALPFLIFYRLTMKKVVVAQWPVCARCRAIGRWTAGIGWTLSLSGLFGIPAGVAIARPAHRVSRARSCSAASSPSSSAR